MGVWLTLDIGLGSGMAQSIIGENFAISRAF